MFFVLEKRKTFNTLSGIFCGILDSVSLNQKRWVIEKSKSVLLAFKGV